MKVASYIAGVMQVDVEYCCHHIGMAGRCMDDTSCYNGGNCNMTSNVCVCRDGWTGDTCQIGS